MMSVIINNHNNLIFFLSLYSLPPPPQEKCPCLYRIRMYLTARVTDQFPPHNLAVIICYVTHVTNFNNTSSNASIWSRAAHSCGGHTFQQPTDARRTSFSPPSGHILIPRRVLLQSTPMLRVLSSNNYDNIEF